MLRLVLFSHSQSDDETIFEVFVRISAHPIIIYSGRVARRLVSALDSQQDLKGLVGFTVLLNSMVDLKFLLNHKLADKGEHWSLKYSL